MGACVWVTNDDLRRGEPLSNVLASFREEPQGEGVLASGGLMPSSTDQRWTYCQLLLAVVVAAAQLTQCCFLCEVGNRACIIVAARPCKVTNQAAAVRTWYPLPGAARSRLDNPAPRGEMLIHSNRSHLKHGPSQ